MTDQKSSRSRQLLELGQIGMESLIRDPVRESVREALAEERILAEDQVERRSRPDDGEQTGNGNRLLRPAILLPVLALAAAGAVMRRQRLMEFMDEKDVLDQTGETISTHAENQRTTSDSTPTDTGDTTGYRTHDDTTGDESTEHGDHNVDTDSEEFSPPE